jgi:hypothetical protein
MKFRNIAELHNKTSEILKEIDDEGYIIITYYGKPTAMIKKISEEEIEDLVIENDPVIKESIIKSYEDYIKNGGTTIEEVMKKLKI